MGDRYLLKLTCPRCKFEDEDVLFAPTCGFTEWKCPDCGTVVDLEEKTGVTKEAASNRSEIREIMNRIIGA